MRLLLVDDDAGLRALVRTTFEDVDVPVDEAASAAEAEERIATARPDVIVLDVGMPGMDGLAFCRALKEDPATAEIRVVLLTGLDEVEDVADAAGADALLLKPFRPLELVERRRATRRRRGRHAAAQVRRPVRGGAAAPVRPRPAPSRRGRAEAARDARDRVPRHRRLARRRAGDQGHRHPPALLPRAALRDGARAGARPGVRRRTPRSSTASCSTTSARSASPSRSCTSRGRWTRPSGA